MIDVVETLIGKGYDIRVYDPNVYLAKLFGANKEYINKKIPHLSRLIVGRLEEIIEHSEVLVIGNGNKEFKEVVERCRRRPFVVDLVRIVSDLNGISPQNYEGLCW